ncbi:MAG: hypothetical protein IKM02_07810 [Clostridia bacterium]|nr:hypothetical protein [Clostridia bacterium]
MRCSCHVCGTYMVHSEGINLGCVCPECGYRCKACLGTDTVISRDNLKNLKFDVKLMDEIFNGPEEPEYERPEDLRPY